MHGAFLQEVIKAGPEPLELRGAGVVEVGEAFGRELRQRIVGDGRVFGQRVADAEFGMADEPDDVAGIGHVDGCAFAGEHFAGIGHADDLAGPGVDGLHVAGENAGADAQEGDLVAVVRIHVRLDLENKAGEFGVVRRDDEFARLAGAGRRSVLQKEVEQELDTEIIEGAAEEDGVMSPERTAFASKISPAASSISSCSTRFWKASGARRLRTAGSVTA